MKSKVLDMAPDVLPVVLTMLMVARLVPSEARIVTVPVVSKPSKTTAPPDRITAPVEPTLRVFD